MGTPWANGNEHRQNNGRQAADEGQQCGLASKTVPENAQEQGDHQGRCHGGREGTMRLVDGSELRENRHESDPKYRHANRAEPSRLQQFPFGRFGPEVRFIQVGDHNRRDSRDQRVDG